MKPSIKITYGGEPVDVRALLHLHDITENDLLKIIGDKYVGEFTIGMNSYDFKDMDKAPKRDKFNLLKDGEVVLENAHLKDIAEYFNVAANAVSQFYKKKPKKLYHGHLIVRIETN